MSTHVKNDKKKRTKAETVAQHSKEFRYSSADHFPQLRYFRCSHCLHLLPHHQRWWSPHRPQASTELQCQDYLVVLGHPARIDDHHNAWIRWRPPSSKQRVLPDRISTDPSMWFGQVWLASQCRGSHREYPPPAVYKIATVHFAVEVYYVDNYFTDSIISFPLMMSEATFS